MKEEGNEVTQKESIENMDKKIKDADSIDKKYKFQEHIRLFNFYTRLK